MTTDTILTDTEVQALYVAGDAAHDFDHVLRVTKMAIRIARAEGADINLVRIAALLHDVPVTATCEQDEAYERRASHHFAAAETARKFLSERGLGTSEIENIVHSIEAHRFRDRSVQPQTLEAKCLYDADKLDAIGAIGIARAFAYAGAHGNRLWTSPASVIREKPTLANDYTPVHEYVFKLKRLLDSLFTPSARQIGLERHDFMASFFNQLDSEMENKQ